MITCSKNQISLGTAPVGLENNRLQTALRRGGSSPEVSVANMYTNSVTLSGRKCLTTTFENPRSKYFTSVTAYDEYRYLMEGVENVNSYTWADNGDGTITVSFNCGETAVNNIDTGGQDFSFTMRYYGVSQQGIVSVRSPGCS